MFVLLQVDAPSDWAIFFGRIHPLVVHLPIGILCVAFGLAWLIWKKKQTDLTPTLQIILLWATISAVVSCVAGYLLGLGGDYDPELLEEHQWLGIGLTIYSGILWGLVKYEFFKKYTFHLLAGQMFLLASTGHHGGSLTHGSSYLTDYLPQPFRAWMGMSPRSSEAPTQVAALPADPASSLAYRDVVEPFLRQRCWQCHNQDKQKGDLRMDSHEWLMKGGEHGPILLAGKPDDSEMIKRLLLDPSDEHHMPPKGKTPLTETQIVLLHWWIEQGASFDKKVAQLNQNEQVAQIFAGKNTATSAAKALPAIVDIPSGDAPALDADVLTKVQKQGVMVLPVSTSQHWVMANFINARSLNDQDLASALANIAKSLIWLKLGGTQAQSQTMTQVEQCTHLTKLSLENTKINDQELQKLKNLPQLVSLNLYGTAVSDQSVAIISGMKNLRQLYIWQTKISAQGIAQIKQKLPLCEVVAGGYALQKLSTDTTQVKPNTQ
jgi:uncharacterized membrane protein